MRMADMSQMTNLPVKTKHINMCTKVWPQRQKEEVDPLRKK